MRLVILVLILISSYIGIASAETEIYCAYCEEHVYTYKYNVQRLKESLNPEDLEPANDFIRYLTVRDEFNCPYDEAPLNGYKYFFWKRGLHEPVMVYPAVTVRTKNSDGDWVWSPWELDIDDKTFNP